MSTDLFTIEFGAEKAFVAGAENSSPVSAAQRFCDDWQQTSPLLFYGPPLAGKSLLARSLATHWRCVYPEHKVLFVPGSDYARDFAEACHAETVDMFSQRMRSCDLFVLDAIEEIADKTAAVEHLCRTLDALDRRGSACVVTSRTLPAQQRRLSPGLISRLSQGLCIPVVLPEFQTRRQLVQMFAQQHGVTLSEENCDVLAGRLTGGAMQIENTIASLATRFDGEMTPAELNELLREHDATPALTLKKITSLTSKICSVRVADMKSPSRRSSHVHARGLAMLAARRLTDFSLNAIGKQFGGRDHTTVMHACEKTDQLIRSDQQTRQLWEELLSQLDEHRSSAATPTPAGENLSADCASCP